jgi:hypothetical protein
MHKNDIDCYTECKKDKRMGVLSCPWYIKREERNIKKIKINRNVARIADYTLWTIAIFFAFWADWRIGIAFLAFDTMRAFEDMQKL